MDRCPLLSTRVSAGYAGRPAVLRDAALEISPGEIVGLVGESGSGKSTMALALLRLVAVPGRMRCRARYDSGAATCWRFRKRRCGAFAGGRSGWCCRARLPA